MSTPSRRGVLTAIAASATGAVLLSGTAAPAFASPSHTRHTASGAPQQAAAKKAMVGYFYDRLFNHGNLAVVDRFVRDDYIQHNPQIADGPTALKKAVKDLRAAHPDLHVTVHRILAQGDLVIVHSNFVLTPGTKGSAVFDIFRVRHGKIAEHWDVQQQVPDTTASGHDMFSTLSSPQREWPDPRVSSAHSKAVATALFDEVFQGRDVSAFDRYVAGPYYQHSPMAPDGTEVPKRLLTGLFASPYFNVSTKRVVADGDYVAIHSHFHFADDRGVAIVDLYRVRDGKVVEHWDIQQPVPETSANDNTMF